MALRITAVDRDRAPDRLDRSLRLSALQRNDAEMMQAREVIAVAGEHPPIERLASASWPP